MICVTEIKPVVGLYPEPVHSVLLYLILYLLDPF